MLILITSTLFQEHRNTVKYFLFQSIGSILLLLRLTLLTQIKIFRCLFMIIKLGIAPFHLWFIRLIRKITLFNLVWLTVLQKVIPLRFLSLIKESSALIILLILRFFLSVVFIIIQIKFIYIIGASSIYSITWVVISLIYREYTIWRFFYLYSIFQMLTLGIAYNVSLLPFKSSLFQSTIRSNTVLIISVFIAGFPPSPLFFIKLRVIYQFIIIHKLIRIMLILEARLVMFNYINIRMILFIISPRKLIN